MASVAVRGVRLPAIRWSMVRALYICRYAPLLLTAATPLPATADASPAAPPAHIAQLGGPG